MRHKSCLWLLFLVVCVVVTLAVDRSKFRTCADTGFCRRYRNKVGPTQGDHYTILRSTLRQASANQIIGQVQNPSLPTPLNIEVHVLRTGSIRVKVNENVPRWQPADILLPSGLVSGDMKVLSAGDSKLPSNIRALPKDSYYAISADSAILVLHMSPLKIELYRGDTRLVVINERSLFHHEAKGAASAGNTARGADNGANSKDAEDRHGGKNVVDYGEDGLAIYDDGTKEVRRAEEHSVAMAGTWAETFGGHTDTMPNGPMSVGVDIAFPFAQQVYGLPEHTSPLSLPTTTTGSAGLPPRYSQPYRLYNLDVFEYELDETMALYGHVPFLMAHGLVAGKGTSVGVFWFNPTEAFVDISDGGSTANLYKESHWMFESGEIDLFLFPGSSPMSILQQLTAVTGRQQLPPIFSLGYHQCRWNYRDEKDVATVEAGFEELDYPVDVIWLDIEHTDGKRYFTWDKAVFPNPIEMQQNLSSHGRRMVTIIDPHIKRDNNFHIHKEATDLGLYIKDTDGSDFKGWCWPGESSYLDFTDARVRTWWAQQFALDKYKGSTLDLFTWNDMNEPSVFNGPEVSMRKDVKNLAGIEHREWHNLYGLYMQRATGEGQVLRAPSSAPKPRPFVLTRAFWAGSQRFGAMWTGDNIAQWGHLKIAAPMLLSISLAGFSFAGADVGGFFGDPDAELFTRWYQAGAFTPFFRGHAHHDSKRREPWVFGDPYTGILRSVAMLRYSLLPYWYTTFYAAHTKGFPVMRPLFVEYPDDRQTFELDDQWMIGDSLLVKPITNVGETTAQVYFPGQHPWYELSTLERYPPSQVSGGRVSVPAPISTIPVFIRGGRIIPRKLRLRRASKLMFYDPITLIVALDNDGGAEGYLYMDDETTMNHENGAFILRSFTFKKNFLLNSAASSWSPTSAAATAGSYDPANIVERIIIVGLSKAPSKVTLKMDGSKTGNVGAELTSTYNEALKMLVIKKPAVKVSENWSISLQ